jgi:hypothetical protein
LSLPGRLTTVQEELNATELSSSDPSGSTSIPDNDNIGRDDRDRENHEEVNCHLKIAFTKKKPI